MDGMPYKPSVYDRLQSIALDVAYVRTVAAANPELAIIPNLRCGEWYVPPELAQGRQAYFKSTDGHTGEWDFNIRRANMHLLPLIESVGGLILVDATRRGKRFPDALSKTVPLWCATINRACALRRQRQSASGTNSTSSDFSWSKEVVVPTRSVSRSEHWDIEQRVDGWAEKLLASSLPLPDLAYPLRPIHLSPADDLSTLAAAATLGFYPVICLSASRFIATDDERQMIGNVAQGTNPATERWRYEQGAGDDHELWSAGLTPAAFWHELPAGWVRLPKADVERLVQQSAAGDDLPGSHVAATDNKAATVASSSPCAVDRILPTSSVHLATLPLTSATLDEYACIILSPLVGNRNTSRPASAANNSLGPPPELSKLLVLPTKPPKSALPPPGFLEKAIDFATYWINRGRPVVVACEGGTDGSVGVAVVLLQALFAEDGHLRTTSTEQPLTPSKATLSTRLQWAITARPRANPSRKTLQHINQFFLSSAFRPAAAVVSSSLTATDTGS